MSKWNFQIMPSFAFSVQIRTIHCEVMLPIPSQACSLASSFGMFVAAFVFIMIRALYARPACLITQHSQQNSSGQKPETKNRTHYHTLLMYGCVCVCVLFYIFVFVLCVFLIVFLMYAFVCIYVFVCMYICVCVCVCIHIHHVLPSYFFNIHFNIIHPSAPGSFK